MLACRAEQRNLRKGKEKMLKRNNITEYFVALGAGYNDMPTKDAVKDLRRGARGRLKDENVENVTLKVDLRQGGIHVYIPETCPQGLEDSMSAIKQSAEQLGLKIRFSDKTLTHSSSLVALAKSKSASSGLTRDDAFGGSSWYQASLGF